MPTIVKQRFSKKYRHSLLDTKLTLSRLKQVTSYLELLLAFPAPCPGIPQNFTDMLDCDQEVRSILRARKLGVPTPVLYLVEHEASSVYMERVEGCSVKAALHEGALTADGTLPPCN